MNMIFILLLIVLTSLLLIITNNIMNITYSKEYYVDATPAPGSPAPGPAVSPASGPPTVAPTQAPTHAPTHAPTQTPTQAPTQVPTVVPIGSPAIGNNLHTSYGDCIVDNCRNITSASFGAGAKDKCNNYTPFMCDGGVGGFRKCKWEEASGGYCYSIPAT